MNVQDCIFFQLNKANQAGTDFWHKKVEHLGVTASQALVLNFLGVEDRVPAYQLGQRLKITSATLTGIVDRLEKSDLVERRPHPEDRRAILVCLTGKGQKYAKNINRIMDEANQEFLNGFTLEESQLLRGLLKRVRKSSP